MRQHRKPLVVEDLSLADVQLQLAARRPLYDPLYAPLALLEEKLQAQSAKGRQYGGILAFERSQRDYSGVVEETITTRHRRDVTALIRSAFRTPTGTNAPLPAPRLAPIGPLAPQPVDVQARRARLYTLQRSAAALAPSRRVALCHRLPSSGGQVDVRATPDGRAYLGGVQTCGSVWHCPVCAAKVTERRRQEVQQLGDWTRQQGGQLLMLTLTVPHSRHDSLEDLVARQRGAYRYLTSGKNALARMFPGYLGTVRAQELTVGENGWHPHWHTLVALDAPLSEHDLDVLARRIHARWGRAVLRVGLGEISHAGSSLVPARLAGDEDEGSEGLVDYICKWGAAEELTKLHTKDARGKTSRTPWQLLIDYAAGDEQAGALWCEYSEVLHGGRQLVWSHGLKALVGLDDQDDDEVAAELPDGATVMRVLTREEWVAVRSVSAPATLLEQAEAGTGPLELYLSATLESWYTARGGEALHAREYFKDDCWEHEQLGVVVGA